MKLLSALAFGYLLILANATALGQCDSGMLYANGNAFVYRVGSQLFTSASAWATGADSEYATTTVTLYDRFQGQDIESHPSASSGPSQTASVSLDFPYTNHGFGVYETTGYVELYDACTGRLLPPYDIGGPWIPAFDYNLQQPILTFSGSSSAPSGLYAEQYSQYNPDGSTPVYATIGNLNANLNGIVGTPFWVLTGQTQAVTTTCLPGGQPCQFQRIQTNQNAHAVAGCQPAVTAYFTVDGIASTSVNIMILTAAQRDAINPSTGQHADHLGVAGGYESHLWFQEVDSCGTPLGYVLTHEEFPNGFAYLLQSNWATPLANSWNVGVDGGWYDKISFADTSGQAVPTPSSPQSPLNGTAVYSGLQNIFVNPVLVNTKTQVHFIDHGDYQ